MSHTITAETKRRLALGLPLNPQNKNRRRRPQPLPPGILLHLALTLLNTICLIITTTRIFQ